MIRLAPLLALLASAPALAGSLSLDRATAEELAAIEGVGPELGEAIVRLRAERGGHLSSVEALRVLPGVDDPTLDRLRENTEVEWTFNLQPQRTYASADEVLAEFAHEPSVRDVQVWSADYAQVQPEMVRRWMSAARTFALLPRLRLDYQVKDGWDQDFIYITDGEDVIAELDDAGRKGDMTVKVQGTWDLNELVMSSERIRVINEAQDVVKLRDKVLTEATRVYFERRRVQVDMLLTPKSDLGGQLKDQLRLMELTANLDALTGGAFTRAVAGGER